MTYHLVPLWVKSKTAFLKPSSALRQVLKDLPTEEPSLLPMTYLPGRHQQQAGCLLPQWGSFLCGAVFQPAFQSHGGAEIAQVVIARIVGPPRPWKAQNDFFLESLSFLILSTRWPWEAQNDTLGVFARGSIQRPRGGGAFLTGIEGGRPRTVM